jgi:hypothetical protein
MSNNIFRIDDETLEAVFELIDQYGPAGVDISELPTQSDILAAGYLVGYRRVFVIGGGGYDTYIVSTSKE